MGKDNITFHCQIWPAELLAYDGTRRPRAASRGEYGDAQPAHRGGRSRVPDDGGQAVLHQPRARDPRRRHAGALPARRAALLHLRRPARRPPDADFTWAEFVQRTNSELVAGWGNLVNRTATMIAKNFGEIPRAGDARAGRRGGAGRRARRLRHGRRPDRPAPAAAGDRRGDAGRRRGQQVPHRHRALQDEGRRRSASGWHRAARRRAVRARLQHAARAVPAALVQPVWTGARRRGRVHADAADRAGRGPRPRRRRRADVYPVITGDYSATPPLGVAARSWSAPRSRKPTPIFTKLDPSVVDEELARLTAAGG